ncbi:MAG: EAL domain-containing protein [Myxococcota bacterium]
MKTSDNRPGLISGLHMQAGEDIALSPAETLRLLQELRVHQIELEMQNEELRRAQDELETARARYFDLYDLAPVGYVTVSGSGLVLEANLTAATLLGVNRESLVNQPFSRFITSEDQDIYYLSRKKLLETGTPQACELRMVKTDKTVFWAQLEATATKGPSTGSGQVTDGEPACRIVLSDITRQVKDQEAIRRLARFDPLTQMPNRAFLIERLNHNISVARRSQETLALMFLDLDHFKNINDTLGHRIGDKLLRDVAKRLTSLVREHDMVSRPGGDEFVIVLPLTDANAAAHVAEKLLDFVGQPYRIEHHDLEITPSIGIAIYPVDGNDFDSLYKSADTAMYRAKQCGRNSYRFFTPEMHESSARVLQLENDLRHAMKRNQLLLHYQPKLSMKDLRITGVEALLRWQHPELGMIPPLEFIPIAESSGQILKIGEWVLRSAVRQSKDWLDSGLAPMTMAVNLSAAQFLNPGLPEQVKKILDEAGLPPQYLELELTENVAMGNPSTSIEVMNRLHAIGVRMSIDDFGTGYSSLDHLNRFRAYRLKIDRSFVSSNDESSKDRAVAGAIISLAGSLGLQTVAEGVETLEQLAFLREKGCNEAQGYYLCVPLPAGQLEAFIREKVPFST